LLMRQNDVDRILKDEVLEGYVENKKLKFLIGEEVNIIDGPFQSFVGLIYKLYDDEKIDLDVKIFGRSSIVSLNTNQIAKKL